MRKEEKRLDILNRKRSKKKSKQQNENKLSSFKRHTSIISAQSADDKEGRGSCNATQSKSLSN